MRRSLELASMIAVGVEVGCHDHAIAELASSERLLRVLTIQNRIELHKYLTTSGNVDT
jgi:hypothetical protein